VGDRDAFGEAGGTGCEDYVAGGRFISDFEAIWGGKSGNLGDFEPKMSDFGGF
jgi:hypothetical protein